MSDLIRRDDAIRELSGACSNWEDDAKVQEIVKALPSADAVEYESTVTLNSPISISAEAVQGVGRYEKAMQKLREMPRCLNGVKVKQINKIQSEAVQGEWIGYNADKEDWLRTDGTPIFLVCDKCHGTVINNGSAHWNYCPNCGARMKGGGTE